MSKTADLHIAYADYCRWYREHTTDMVDGEPDAPEPMLTFEEWHKEQLEQDDRAADDGPYGRIE